MKGTPHKYIMEDNALIGLCYDNIGDSTKAIKHYEKTIEIADKIFVGINPEATEVTDSDSILGSLNKERKDYALYHYRLGRVFQDLKSATSN
jgi:septum formation inhibitor-activating ATPase MinD